MVSKIETQMPFWRIFKQNYPCGAKEWNVNWINKTGGERNIWNLKLLKATSNGLRQQSVTGRAVIKVSCS